MTAMHHQGDAADPMHPLLAEPRGAEDVEVVVRPFTGFGRLAHLRRQLLSLPAVDTARIAGYGPGEARFRVGLTATGTLDDLRLPGTRISHMSATLVSLAVDAG